MTTENNNETLAADLRQAVEVLKKGGVILYPTDTVWGLGCDATNPEAVARIYSIKQRRESKSMLVLADDVPMLERYVDEVPEVGYQLLEAAVNPLTIIYDGARGLASNLVAADGSVGIRLTSEKFSYELCRRLRRPIVSTSANISGNPTPHNFAEISEQIKEAVDFIPQYRRDDLRQANPSSIIRLHNDGRFQLIR